MLNWFIIIFITISSSLFASVKKELDNYKEDIKSIRDDLEVKKDKIIKLDAAINTLEKDLGSKNDTYLRKIKKIETIESEIIGTRDLLKESQKNSTKLIRKSKRIFGHLVLNSIDAEEDLLEKKMIESFLNKSISDLRFTLKNYKQIHLKLNFLTKKLEDYKSDEKELYDIILNLEQRKKSISQDFVASKHKKKKLEDDLSAIKNKLKPKEVKSDDGDFKLSLPLASFKEAKLSKKGLSITPNNRKRLRSPEEGKVVYSGQLSTYGNLIIIEHKDKIRSVILGQFVPTKNKGDLVQKDEYIGRIVDIKKEIYFEIRKENKAQKISRWLENKSLKRVL